MAADTTPAWVTRTDMSGWITSTMTCTGFTFSWTFMFLTELSPVSVEATVTCSINGTGTFAVTQFVTLGSRVTGVTDTFKGQWVLNTMYTSVNRKTTLIYPCYTKVD